MSRRGELNIGQLVRGKYGNRTLLVGFSTCRGTVTAASDWDAAIERKCVQEPLPHSYEEIFQRVNHKQFMLNLRENNEAVDLLMDPKLQRAIGVIYRPEKERQSHYYASCLPEQFDFILHYDETHAVKPLKTTPHWHRGEMDETYSTGL
jgi:erythromycin esterase-like protein